GQPARHSAGLTHLATAGEYLHAPVRAGLERSLGSRIVTYADDLVILCRKGKAEDALLRLREIMNKLKLTVNEEKTRICKVPEEELTFWATPSDECIQREPARRAWDSGHRRRASSVWEKTSTRLPSDRGLGKRPQRWCRS